MDTSSRRNSKGTFSEVAGFTLLESLVAISIITLGLATAAHSFTAYKRDAKLSRTASSLKLLVERAYSHALATRREMIVLIEPTEAKVQNANGTERERLTFKAPIAPELRNNQPQEIRLYPSISASPATITLRLGKSTCEVIVSLRGRVRTQCA
jgi:prepilin-type N-terminal cleavage/methylation domain-containing protein